MQAPGESTVVEASKFLGAELFIQFDLRERNNLKSILEMAGLEQTSRWTVDQVRKNSALFSALQIVDDDEVGSGSAH